MKRHLWLTPLIIAFAVWSILAYMFIFVFAGAHVCSILQPVGQASIPLTQVEMGAQVAARCNRPDWGAIIFFGLGYVVFAVVLWSHWATRNDA
jgi:hypothetical protein